MTTSPIQPTTIKIDKITKERVLRLAEARHRSSHWMILEAIRQYIEREEKYESFKQDAIKAWQDYQRTGLHISNDEADAWLEKLETGQDVEPPECHD